MPFPRLFHLTVRQELHGQVVQNGYYFKSRPGIDDVWSQEQICTSLLNGYLNGVLPSVKAWANQQLKFQNLVVRTISPKFGTIVEVLLENHEGAQGDDSLPSYCAGLISLRTGLGGGFRRGRSYYAGVSENDSSLSRLEADSLNGLVTIGNSLIQQFGFTGGSSLAGYGIWSWKLAGVANNDGEYNTNLAFTPITQCIPRPVIATQRHRKIGHGN